jgi:MSHA biogenesis protein MshP
MKHLPNTNKSRGHFAAAATRQRGVSLITAIFLLVVLAGLGVAMLTISTTQQAGAALDMQGSRAYQAARAGIEWALYQQRWTSADPCASGYKTSFALPAGTTLSSYTVTVECAITTLSTLKRYRIIATACNQPASGACPNASNSPDYVQRRIQIEIGEMQ